MMHTRVAGFSLLEVLMALVLLAVLLAGAFSGIRAATKAMDSGERTIDRSNRLRITQEFLRHEISRTLPLVFGHDKDSGANLVFQGERGFMRFVAPMPGYLSHGGAYVQSLELARGRNGLQLLFTHQILNGFDLEKRKSDEAEPVVLLDGIKGGHFEYRSYDEEGKLGDWADEWEDLARTPLMVRIDIAMKDESQLVWPLMDIPLMLDVGAMPPNLLDPASGFIPQPGDVR